MTTIDNMITLFQTIALVYLFVVLLNFNQKYNKVLLIVLIFVTVSLLSFEYNEGVLNYLIIVIAFTEVYVVYSGSFINNLIKLSLIVTCFNLMTTAIIVIMGQVYKVLLGTNESIPLYGESAPIFSYVARITATLVALILIKILDTQFAEWVDHLKGIMQAILFALLYLIPITFMTISGIFEYENYSLYLTLDFIAIILLPGMAVLITVTFAIISRKKVYMEIQNKIKTLNDNYDNLLKLERRLAALKHDLNNFLEVDSPEYEKRILDYCDLIEEEMEANNE